MYMNYVARQKRRVVLATILSVLCVSLVSSPQAGALSLRDITDGLFGGTRQNETTNDSQSRNTTTTQAPTTNTNTSNTNRNVVEQIVPPQTTRPQQTAPVTPAPTAPAPTTTTSPTPAQTQPARPVQRAVATTPQRTTSAPAVAQAVVAPLDTSADVLKTVNSQTVTETAVKGSPYTTNKLDPRVAESLMFAGIATITAGVLMYAASIFPFKKQVRHIPVKSL